MLAAGVHQELQTVKLLLQIRQLENLRLVIGTVHIMDTELLEVTDNNPAGDLIKGQISSITPCLLKWGQHRAVRLPRALL